MQKEDKYGALWLKESKAGKKYMSGVVGPRDNEERIVVFKNNYKEKENHPDYIIYKSKPREESSESDKQVEQVKKEFQDDIPF